MKKRKDMRADTFWYSEKDKLKIDDQKFLNLLGERGFRKFYVGDEYLLVKIENNIVREVKQVHIKDFITEYINSLGEEPNGRISPEMILGKIINQQGTLFSRGNLEFLSNLEDKFKRDNQGEAFFYFQNCFVKATKDGITTHNYAELDGFIWDRQILSRDFHISDGNSVFKVFINNICRGDISRIKSLESGIGYLLHSFKNPASARAIIFTDERIGEGASGGNGKSLVGDAISRLRISVRPDGQNFSFDRFMFQTVKPGTAVIEFNDAKENFQFQRLFSVITDSMILEKKYETAYILPFEHSPKILISTNHSIKGVDVSTLRRQFIVEFSDHYNEHHVPVDDFGKIFFNGWTAAEWNEFDNYMIGCAQRYLKNGLVDYNRKNWYRKVLLESTSEEFVFAMEEVEMNKWYSKKYLFNKFFVDYPEHKYLQQKNFTQWIKTYAKIKEYKYDEKKSGAERSFKLSMMKRKNGRMDE